VARVVDALDDAEAGPLVHRARRGQALDRPQEAGGDPALATPGERGLEQRAAGAAPLPGGIDDDVAELGATALRKRQHGRRSDQDVAGVRREQHVRPRVVGLDEVAQATQDLHFEGRAAAPGGRVVAAVQLADAAEDAGLVA